MYLYLSCYIEVKLNIELTEHITKELYILFIFSFKYSFNRIACKQKFS